jgi:hypothetical protein
MTALTPDAANEPTHLRLSTAVGLIGTCVVCFAAMLGSVTEIKLQSFSFLLWIVGLAMQAAGLLLAYNERRARQAAREHPSE